MQGITIPMRLCENAHAKIYLEMDCLETINKYQGMLPN